jgi:hypothetical protein
MSDSTAAPPDLVTEIRRVLEGSAEPLTAVKIRRRLPAPWRQMNMAALIDVLQRQAAAQVFAICPKYRSGQDRYWDRPLRERVHDMLRDILAAGPLSWAELRRRLPRYARYLAESVLNELIAHGRLHRHPPRSARAAPRFGLEPPDARTYLRPALAELLARLEPLGFSRAELRRELRQLLAASEPVELMPDYQFAGDGQIL